MKRLLVTVFCIFPGLVNAADIAKIVDDHILPRYHDLQMTTSALADVAQNSCEPEDDKLRRAYHAAFDAWISISHVRFGPSEEEQRGFALYFWPDTRGVTQKTLNKMIREEDGIVADASAFPTVSVAVRGFFALEFLVYDADMQDIGSATYRCALLRAIAFDIARSSEQMLAGWQDQYADLMKNAGQNEIYRTEQEAVRQVFTALTTGLEFTADARLGRPLGSFDRPRPKRAEARRSGRSLRHIALSLEATRSLASLLSRQDPMIDARFSAAIERIKTLDDPSLASVADPQGRLRVEALQQSVNDIRQQVAQNLGPALGVAAGFNSLDGD